MISDLERASDRIHDAIAETYGYETEQDLDGRIKVGLLRRHLAPTSKVLDVGCANGLHLVRAARLSSQVVGADINERMLELARARIRADGLENAAVVQASAVDLPFDQGSFDAVYSFSTLLLIPDIHRALNEIARVLAPQGVAILDIVGRRNVSYWRWREWYRSEGHFGAHAMSWSQLTHVLARRRLVPFEVHGTGFLRQWRYVPLLRKLERVDRVARSERLERLDYRLSNSRPIHRLANRWYVVARKE